MKTINNVLDVNKVVHLIQTLKPSDFVQIMLDVLNKPYVPIDMWSYLEIYTRNGNKELCTACAATQTIFKMADLQNIEDLIKCIKDIHKADYVESTKYGPSMRLGTSIANAILYKAERFSNERTVGDTILFFERAIDYLRIGEIESFIDSLMEAENTHVPTSSFHLKAMCMEYGFEEKELPVITTDNINEETLQFYKEFKEELININL